MGSSRPAALSLRNLKISCLIAESINGLFFRNSVNFGLVALQCPGIYAAFEEGQTAEVSTDDLTIRNRETGKVLRAKPVPKQLVDLMVGGGIFPLLEAENLIDPPPPSAKKSGKATQVGAG